MGIFDKAKDLLNQHNDKVDQGIDKAAEFINSKTGGQQADKITQGAQRAKDAIDDHSGHPRDGVAGQPPVTDPTAHPGTTAAPGAQPTPGTTPNPVTDPTAGPGEGPGQPRI